MGVHEMHLDKGLNIIDMTPIGCENFSILLSTADLYMSRVIIRLRRRRCRSSSDSIGWFRLIVVGYCCYAFFRCPQPYL